MKLNNERLPNKNTKSFDNGYPLCHYVLDALKKVIEIDDIYVYCSNPSIKNYIPSGIKFLQRSKDLDTSNTSMNEVLNHFAKDVDSDIYLLTHATSPFVQSTSIRDALKKVTSGEYDSALAVQKIQEFLWSNGSPLNYNLDNIPRTQDLPELFAETSGFYIFDKNHILNYNRRIGFNPYLKIVNKIEAVDVDDEDDFNIANSIFNSLFR